VDLSALIFVALAVAWAVYLIPKALKHHDEVVRSRSVEKLSHTMRVLARASISADRSIPTIRAPARAAGTAMLPVPQPSSRTAPSLSAASRSQSRTSFRPSASV